MMAKTIPNFGQILKASAQGYKYIDQYRLFVRISALSLANPKQSAFKCEIQPPTFQPEANDIGINAYTSWMTQEGVVALLPALNRYQGRTKYHMFYIDDDGLEIPEPIMMKISKEDLEKFDPHLPGAKIEMEPLNSVPEDPPGAGEEIEPTQETEEDPQKEEDNALLREGKKEDKPEGEANPPAKNDDKVPGSKNKGPKNK